MITNVGIHMMWAHARTRDECAAEIYECPVFLDIMIFSTFRIPLNFSNVPFLSIFMFFLEFLGNPELFKAAKS